MNIPVHVQSWFSIHSSQYTFVVLKSDREACRHDSEYYKSSNICVYKKPPIGSVGCLSM